MEQIYQHFKRSPHKVDMMEEIQKLLEDPVLKYREVHQIRWLSFLEALEAVVRTLDSLLTYFSTTAAKDPKSSGMNSRVGTEMFILMAHGMLDILRPVTALSLYFQQEDIDIGVVRVELNTCIEKLEKSSQPLEEANMCQHCQE